MKIRQLILLILLNILISSFDILGANFFQVTSGSEIGSYKSTSLYYVNKSISINRINNWAFNKLVIDGNTIFYDTFREYESYSLSIPAQYLDNKIHKLEVRLDKYEQSYNSLGSIYFINNSGSDGIIYIVENNVAKVVCSKGDIENAQILDNYIQDKVAYPVTEISESAFLDRKKLRSVIIPSQIKTIGNSAFEGCYVLSSLQYNAINCTSCGSASAPAFPSQIYGNFSVQLADSVKNIPSYFLNNCNRLTSIEIPQSVHQIGSYAFYNTPLQTVIFPNEGLEDIGEGSFAKTDIQDIILGYGIKNIGSEAFAYNAKLKTIIFKDFTPPISNKSHIFFQSKSPQIIVPQKTLYETSSFGNALENGVFIEPITFESNSFIYSGQSPIINYTKNLEIKEEGWSDVIEVKEIAAGNYSSQFSIYLNDYNISLSIPFSYSIEKAPLCIQIENVTREYGIENPILKYGITGFVNNENESVFEIPISLETNAKINSAVGEYEINIIGGTSNNYYLKYNPGKFSIIKAPLTIIANEKHRKYGEENPIFTFSYEGIRLDETETEIFSQLPNASTDANIMSEVGTYSIRVSGGIAKNYDITDYQAGSLIIEKASLLLKANDTERNYYEDNPNFNFTLEGLLNNDNLSCLLKKPSFSCAAALDSDCGDYLIVPSGAEAKNYEIDYQNGHLTIIPSNLIVFASDVNREYGDPNPVLKYEAIGLKGNDELQTSMIDEPQLVTEATEKSNVGEYAITISGGSSKNYTLSYRQGTLTVTKAPLTVIAEDAEREYGENNPDFTRAYLGFKLNDTESTAFSSLPRITCAATTTSDAGKYSITVASGTSRNYELSEYQNGTLTVTKAPIVLTATDISRMYFESNPQFDYTITGLKNSDTKTSIGIAPTFDCSATINSNAGQYPIIPSGAEAKNYTFDYQNGTLTVNQRSLSASVGNYTRKYNVENPNFVVEYTGFVNGEDESVLSHPVIVSCDATKTSDVGTYILTLTGGEAVNYAITKYNSGNLTIEKADQTLTWNQDLSNIDLYSQVALTATSDSGLDVYYEMSPNNVATLYDNAGTWYLDCYGSGAVSIRAIQNGNNNYNATSMIAKTLVVNGAGSDPSNPQIYLDVPTAGSLPNLIADNRKYQIKNLRLSGYLNGTDINYIREMAGSDSYGNATAGILETLDISSCTIVSGGRNYYKSCQTSNYEVGDYMFYNCKVLVNLMLPENTTTLGDYALAECNRLSVLSMPNSVTSFGDYAFRNNMGLIRIPMPNDLITIGDMAFYGCNNLTELTLPRNVKALGDGIVRGCENLAAINVEPGNSTFASEKGVLYSSNLDELIIFPVGYTSSEYSVSENTLRVAPYAFYNAKGLKKVTLPKTLSAVGQDAFIGSVNLTTLGIRALTPPICENDCFESVCKTRCELQVPRGCYSYYWVAPVWSEFNNIKETTFDLGIEENTTGNINVVNNNGTIIISGVPENMHVMIFTTEGTLIYYEVSKGCIQTFTPSIKNVYVISVNNLIWKINI